MQETGDGSGTLFTPRYAQTFHSLHGAVTESRHVFLEGSGVAERLRQGEAVKVLEVGFGTGLNFLLTAQAASTGSGTLHYVALERQLVPVALLARLDYARFAPAAFAALLEFRRRLAPGTQAGTHRSRVAGSLLELRLGEAQEARLGKAEFDAIYHDGFSPDTNPELWDESFLSRLAAALAPGGTLVSYTVKGVVRRQLAAAGLEVTKLAGPPGGKKEMLRAVRRGPA